MVPSLSRRRLLAGLGLASAGGAGALYEYVPEVLPGALAEHRLLHLSTPTPIGREVAPTADHCRAAAAHGERLRDDAAALWDGIDEADVESDFDSSWYPTRVDEAADYLRKSRNDAPSVDALLYARMVVERTAPALGAGKTVTDSVDLDRIRSRGDDLRARERRVRESTAYAVDDRPSLALGRLAWAERALHWGSPPDDGYVEDDADPSSWEIERGANVYGSLESDARRLDDAKRLIAHHRASLDGPRPVADDLRDARESLQRDAGAFLPNESEFDDARGDRSSPRDWAGVGATGMVFNDRTADPYSGVPDDGLLAYGVLEDAKAALRGRAYRFAMARIDERTIDGGVSYDTLLRTKREGLRRLRRLVDDTGGKPLHRLLLLQAANALLVGDFPLEDWTGPHEGGLAAAKAEALGRYLYGLGQLRALPGVVATTLPTPA